MMRAVYLHGFASGPASSKARMFGERLAGIGVECVIPDLVPGRFREITVTGQLEQVRRAMDERRAVLIGSSLGGYLAALFAARRPELVERVILLAPAFAFASRWARGLGEAKMRAWAAAGTMPVMHYGLDRMVEVGWQFIEDARRYEADPEIAQPCLLFHGTRDDVVDSAYSERYAAARPNVRLRLKASDHQLLDVFEEIWTESREFLLREE